MTAFFAFMNDERENVQKDNPGMAHTGIAKIVGEMWKALSAENKKIYVDNNKMAMVQERKLNGAHRKAHAPMRIAQIKSRLWNTTTT